MRYLTIVSTGASLTIKSRYANIFVCIDCENNRSLNKIVCDNSLKFAQRD